MKFGCLAQLARKAIAVSVASALLLMSPGLGAYRAFAQEFKGEPVRSKPVRARTVSRIQALGALSAPLGAGVNSVVPVDDGAGRQIPQLEGASQILPASKEQAAAPSPAAEGLSVPRQAQGPGAVQTAWERLSQAAAAAIGLGQAKTSDALKSRAGKFFGENLSRNRGDVPAPAAAGASRWFAPRPEAAVQASAQASPSSVRGPPKAPPSDQPPPPPGGQASNGGQAEKYLHEDFLGFRRQDGLKHDPDLKSLAFDAKTSEIIDQIARQFFISREKVLNSAAKIGLTEASPAAGWFAVYDRLQKRNAEQFKMLDHAKYENDFASEAASRLRYAVGRRLRLSGAVGAWLAREPELGRFRTTDKSYAEGWKGVFQRASEAHVHFVGIFFRFVYHLFDSFVLGYFRQSMSFEWFHSTEDYLNLAKPGSAQGWLERALAEQSKEGLGKLGPVLATPWGRMLNHRLVAPILVPLKNFVLRRLTMALASAVGMGMLGAAAPILPFMSLSLTALPVAGPLLLSLAHALPLAVAHIPVMGSLVAPAVGHALTALISDLVVGRMLNTAILSTFLTLPHAIRERVMELQRENPALRLSPSDWLQASVQALFSWTFWKRNALSFLGMMTVGAEIAGVMKYAANIDAFVGAHLPLNVAPQFAAVTGHKFNLFYAMGSAVEKPKGESAIPFGGAITWGNSLLYNVQGLTGFNISDHVMHFLNPHTAAIEANLAYEGALVKGFSFDKDLYGKSPAEVKARIAMLRGHGALLDQEIDATKARREELGGTLAQVSKELAALRQRSHPVSPQEQAQYEKLAKEALSSRDERYVRAKLAQLHDLANPPSPDSAAKLRELKALDQHYKDQLSAQAGEKPASWDDLGVKDAQMKALSEQLQAKLARSEAVRLAAAKPGQEDPQTAQIRALVEKIEGLRNDARTELKMRDAARSLFAIDNKLRNDALRERRDFKGRLDLIKNTARLSTVMDATFGLNKIYAAERVINQAQQLLQQKAAAILASQNANQKNLQAAANNLGQAPQWTADAQKALAQDNTSLRDMETLQGETSRAHDAIQSFSSDISGFMGALAAKYANAQANLDLLPSVVAWRTNGRPLDPHNPNSPLDPNYLYLNEFAKDQEQVSSYLSQARDGLKQLATTPVEFAGATIAEVPGPQWNVTNPTKDQTLQMLSDRKAHWAAEEQPYLDNLATVKALLDADGTNTAMLTDDFGGQYPQSLPKYRTVEQNVENAAKAYLYQPVDQSKDLAQNEGLLAFDRLAADVNARLSLPSGQQLPANLENLPLADLQAAVENYAAKIEAVPIPSGSDANVVLAETDLLAMARILPHAADNVIQYSLADATLKAINDALATTLPQAQTGLAAVKKMFDGILSDADTDVAYVNAPSHTAADRKALLDRKTALLNGIVSTLQNQAEPLLSSLIAYQKQSIDTVQPGGQYSKLFSGELTVTQATKDAYSKTVPWILAAHGAPVGDVQQARSSVAAWRQMLQNQISGYDDASGHHEGLQEGQNELNDRTALQGTSGKTEVLYGETQPYSLYDKIAVYGGELAQRAQQLNAQDLQINAAIDKIKQASNGRYDLSALKLPTNLAPDASGSWAAAAARAQALVDGNAVQNLADQLQAIGNAALPNAGVDGLNSSPDSALASGVQPAIQMNTYAQEAIAVLQGVARLAPSSQSTSQSPSASYSLARLLYSNSVVNAADSALATRIPEAKAFLAQGFAAVNGALAQADQDLGYVNSYDAAAGAGTSESAQSVYSRNVANYGALASFLTGGIAYFTSQKDYDSQPLGSGGTIGQMQTYYSGLQTIYNSGQTVNTAELQEVQVMQAELASTLAGFEATKQELLTWLAQLNDPHDSALRKVMDSVSTLQDQTRNVLEKNIKFRDVQKQLSRSETLLNADLNRIDREQRELASKLQDPGLRRSLPPELAARIDKLRDRGGAWSMEGGRADNSPAVAVIRKSEFASLLEPMLSKLLPHQSLGDFSQLKADILNNPRKLCSLIPDSQLIDFGDSADGFYLLYQTSVALPNLSTDGSITLGNLLRGVSVTGYQYMTPAATDNAPAGGKGIDVSYESLGDRQVNYLDVDLHKLVNYIPVDATLGSQLQVSRLMIFDDYALMAFGDRLYVGLAGYADGAFSRTAAQQPYYYGESAKTSFKLYDWMSLDAQQQSLIARDPRMFLQTLNLDPSGMDPILNQTLAIQTAGYTKTYTHEQGGVKLDLAKLIGKLSKSEAEGKPEDAFTMDLYFAKTGGTDDIAQKSLGASVLKGFSLRDSSGKPWAVITTKTTGEAGQAYNTLKEDLSVSLPNYGAVISGRGELMGDAKSFYAQISKKTGDHSNASLSYGSEYPGMPNRLSVSWGGSVSLNDLVTSAAQKAAENLAGGRTMQEFDKGLDEFYKSGQDQDSKAKAEELARVFQADVARKLITQDMGALTREIDGLRSTGALVRNTKMRATVGYVSGPVSADPMEARLGGGAAMGTYVDLVNLSKTQKELVGAKTEALYAEGLRLRSRMLDLTKEWEQAVTEVAQAQWEAKLALFAVENAPSAAARGEAEVAAGAAKGRLHQALLDYNALAGRDLNAPPPFGDLTTGNLEALIGRIRGLVASPDGLEKVLGSLDPDEIKSRLGKPPFDIMAWIPWVDQLTLSVGVQLQDMLSSQFLAFGGSLRLPIYDPASKESDHAYRLEKEAEITKMSQAYRERRLAAEKELLEAGVRQADAKALRPGLPKAAENLDMAIRGYRNNGAVGAAELKQAFDSWRWYAENVLSAESRAALAEAWSAADATLAKPMDRDPNAVTIASLDEAVGPVFANSDIIKEFAKREEAAGAMKESLSHRVSKAWVDVGFGTGVTEGGSGWLPSVGLTGFGITPVPGFEFKPMELKELQMSEGQGETDYYRLLQPKVRSSLALEFYQDLVSYDAAQKSLEELDKELLPRLKEALAKAEGSGSAIAARRALNEAELREGRSQLARDQALASLNSLLGRSADSPLEIKTDPERALASLRKILAENDPVGTQKKILDARVEIARAYQDRVDKNLKVKRMALDPVSLGVQSLGRLVNMLANGNAANPENAAAAEIQALSEERARENFDKNLQAQISRAKAELALALERQKQLKSKDDPESRLESCALEGKLGALKGELLAMGAKPEEAAASGYEPLPASFTDLKERLTARQREISYKPQEEPLDVLPPDTTARDAASYVRYYFVHKTLGGEALNKGFLDSWLEVRLNSKETQDDETLLKLAQLRRQKADDLYRNDLGAATARANILAEDFKATARMLRWVKGVVANPDGRFHGNLDALTAQIKSKLSAERGEIVALLGLDPKTTLEDLLALAPEDPRNPGDRNLGAVADGLMADIRDMQSRHIRQTLFEKGGVDDSQIQNLHAAVIADKMSYRGFTPIAAGGIFRGRIIGGLFLQAPDTAEIEKGLESVISDALRKDLESTGRLRELALHFQKLMNRVEDGEAELEQRRRLIGDLEAELRSREELARDPAGAAEVASAQERLVRAWLDFTDLTARTKGDFIALETEIEALGEKKGPEFSMLASAPALPSLGADPRGELLSYGTERLLDPSFEGRLAGLVPAAAKERLLDRARAFRDAKQNAQILQQQELSPERRLELLARNDLEGKRQALRAELARALDASDGSLDLLKFFAEDIREESGRSGARRADYVRTARSVREAFWRAAPVPEEAEGAFTRLEALQAGVEAARQALLERYLSEGAAAASSEFILKNEELDSYLKAQEAFDAELAKVVNSPEVWNNRSLAWRLDALYDIRGTLERRIDGEASGRGLLALDALIEIEGSRLEAARWEGSTDAIDRLASSLRTLKDQKKSWSERGAAADLAPLYAATSVDKDGRRLWTVAKWLTAGEFKEKLATKEIRIENGRYYLAHRLADGSVERLEVIGGEDAKETERSASEGALAANDALLDLHARMKDYDFVATGTGPQDKQGYSYDEIFGPDGLLHGQEGRRVFFFDAPTGADPEGSLHEAVHPLTALGRLPETTAVYVYDGKLSLAPGRFPTLESLLGSEEAKDFHRLILSEKGAAALAEKAGRLEAEQLSEGWVETKLNAYGFARDKDGASPARLYDTKAAFDAQREAFKNAGGNFALARKFMDKAERDLEQAGREEESLKAAEEAQAAKFRDVQERVSGRIQADPRFRVPRQAGESDEAYQARLAGELDKAVAQDQEFVKAQKERAPLTNRYNAAVDGRKLAAARADNARRALEDARAALEESKTWSLYENRDLKLVLDRQGRIVEVHALPVYGARALDERLGGGDPGREGIPVTGELLGAIMDGQARIKAFYQSERELERAAANWEIRSVAIQDDDVAVKADGTVKTAFRLSHYQDKASGLPVLLNSRYMTARSRQAESKLFGAKHYGLMPWQLGDVVLEPVRGVVGNLSELVTGRDPNQQHFLGRKSMNGAEGGETDHMGFFRKTAGFIDILNVLPDPVETFYDESQFPASVKVSSPLKFGESLLSKGLRDPATGRNFNLGAQSIARQLAYVQEDLAAARARTLSHFQGGVEETWIDSRIGRKIENGLPRHYERSKRGGAYGEKTLADVLADPSVEGSLKADGSGVVTLSEAPENLAVDRVVKRMTLRPGARQYGREIAALNGYSERLGRERSLAQSRAGDLKKELESARGGLQAAREDRASIEARAAAAWDAARRLGWRIGAQRALESRMDDLSARSAALQREISWWGSYLKRLEDAFGPRPRPLPDRPSPSLALLFGLFLFTLAALWIAFLRRKAGTRLI